MFWLPDTWNLDFWYQLMSGHSITGDSIFGQNNFRILKQSGHALIYKHSISRHALTLNIRIFDINWYLDTRLQETPYSDKIISGYWSSPDMLQFINIQYPDMLWHLISGFLISIDIWTLNYRRLNIRTKSFPDIEAVRTSSNIQTLNIRIFKLRLSSITLLPETGNRGTSVQT